MDKFFGLKANNTDVKTEMIAGVTTFVTMAYIIFVNPAILSDAGMDFASVAVATCIAAALGTLLMGLYAKLPFAQAPGMGLNAFFAYTIVGLMGYTWQQALAAVFISGLLFLALSTVGLREAIARAIPTSLKYAISVGIGFFLARIGFATSGLVTDNYYMVSLSDWAVSKAGILTIIGVIVIGVLIVNKIKGGIILGMIITAVIGIPMGLTTIDLTNTLSLNLSFWQFDFAGLLKLDAGVNILGAVFNLIFIVLAFTLVDMFDTIGTLIGTSQKAGMLDKDGNMPNMGKALTSDAIATSVGAMLGTSTVTTYVESAAGISAGGKTGLTAVTTGVLFIVALIFVPIAGFIPTPASAAALITVGVLMMSVVTKINFDDFSEALPAFATIGFMAFTGGITNGIAAGLIFYTLIKISSGKAKDVSIIVYVVDILFILRFAFMT